MPVAGWIVRVFVCHFAAVSNKTRRNIFKMFFLVRFVCLSGGRSRRSVDRLIGIGCQQVFVRVMRMLLMRTISTDFMSRLMLFKILLLLFERAADSAHNGWKLSRIGEDSVFRVFAYGIALHIQWALAWAINVWIICADVTRHRFSRCVLFRSSSFVSCNFCGRT